MPCRHDARAAWLGDPSVPTRELPDLSPGRDDELADPSHGRDDCDVADDDFSDHWPEDLAALTSDSVSPSG
jgi:hypothetical protein